MSNDGVTLKSGLRAIQGHWKWRHSIDHIGLTSIVGHCKYSCTLYHFRDKARHWSKIAIFHIPAFVPPPLRGLRRNIAIPFGMVKPESDGEKIWRYVIAVSTADGQTDRQTGRQVVTVPAVTTKLPGGQIGNSTAVILWNSLKGGTVQWGDLLCLGPIV